MLKHFNLAHPIIVCESNNIYIYIGFDLFCRLHLCKINYIQKENEFIYLFYLFVKLRQFGS